VPTATHAGLTRGLPTPVRTLVRRGLAGPGVALPGATRAALGAELGHDFSRVRVHADEHAAASAAALGAAAYTVGQHIAFGRGRYEPRRPGGHRLLRHELVHTMQQPQATAVPAETAIGPEDAALERQAAGRGAGRDVGRSSGAIVQRQPSDKPSSGAVAANEVMPFATGTKLRVSQLLRPVLTASKSLLEMAGDKISPEAWELINLLIDPTAPAAVDATVTASTPKQFKATIAVPEIKATAKRPAVKARTIDLELAATQAGSEFELKLDWHTGSASFAVTARRSDGTIVLSTTLIGQSIEIALKPSGGGVVASTEHPLAKVLAGGGSLELVRVDPLTAQTGTTAAAKEEAAIASKAAATATRPPSGHELSAGAGVAFPAGIAPLLSLGWRFNYRLKGEVLTLPFGVQLDYVPGPEVTGKVLTGSVVGGGQLRFPVAGVPMTLSLVGGVRAGAAGLGEPSPSAVAGPVGGLRGSIDVTRSLRVYVGAEYFRNVLQEAAEKRDFTGEFSLQVGTTLRL
jgi:Domain of unknown function (DUF4157)